MKKRIKKLLHKIIYRYYIIKCSISIVIYGTKGLIIILENLPDMFIIPLMKRYGLSIGSGCRILPGILFNNLSSIKPFENLEIGNNVYIGRKVLLDLTEKVSIGDDSMFGAGVQIWTHAGDFSYDNTDYFERKLPVNIGKGVLCWSRVIISPGVSIGNYSRVTAGSVVISDIGSKLFFGGIPAKFIRKREIKE